MILANYKISNCIPKTLAYRWISGILSSRYRTNLFSGHELYCNLGGESKIGWKHDLRMRS